jgi:predicted alpha/beta-fold hydrolase
MPHFIKMLFNKWVFGPPASVDYLFKPTPFNTKIRNSLSEKVGIYQPPIYYNPHLVTLWQFGNIPEVHYNTQFIQNEHNQIVFTVDWYPFNPTTHSPIDPSKIDQIILFFPGLGQSSNDINARQFAKTVAKNGYICGIINPRGHRDAHSSSNLDKLWHPALTDDVCLLIDKLHQTYSDNQRQTNIILVGFSGSTTLLTNYITHERAKPYITCNCPETSNSETSNSVMIVGAVFCCFVCEYINTKRLMEGSFLGRIYSYGLTSLYKYYLHNPSRICQLSNLGVDPLTLLTNLDKTWYLSQYERDSYRLYGFSSEEQMHSAYQTTPLLSKIPIPTIFMQPADDPFYTLSHGTARSGIPIKEMMDNENIIYIEPSHGAHGGFANGYVDSYVYLPKITMTFFECLLAKNE